MDMCYAKPTDAYKVINTLHSLYTNLLNHSDFTDNPLSLTNTIPISTSYFIEVQPSVIIALTFLYL